MKLFLETFQKLLWGGGGSGYFGFVLTKSEHPPHPIIL